LAADGFDQRDQAAIAEQMGLFWWGMTRSKWLRLCTIFDYKLSNISPYNAILL
jgi:hypothetical protein